MNIYDLLTIIDDLARTNNLSRPFIVGGVVRDRVLGERSKQIKDVDLTTGDDDIKALSRLLAEKFPEAKFREYDDGHTSIDIQGLRIDFSNNFTIPEIDAELKRLGVEQTPMKRELYSRDFTINTLLEDLKFDALYDLTGEGIDDIKAGLIRCPINPDLTIKNDPRRILRALLFSIKYEFSIEDGLKNALHKYSESIKTLPLQFVQRKMGDMIKLNRDKALDLLMEYKLLGLVQLTKPIYDALIERRELGKIL